MLSPASCHSILSPGLMWNRSARAFGNVTWSLLVIFDMILTLARKISLSRKGFSEQVAADGSSQGGCVPRQSCGDETRRSWDFLPVRRGTRLQLRI